VEGKWFENGAFYVGAGEVVGEEAMAVRSRLAGMETEALK
jgi:hypothetical protein